MKNNKTSVSFFGEAISNIKLLLTYWLHIRQADDFLGRQNITPVL